MQHTVTTLKAKKQHAVPNHFHEFFYRLALAVNVFVFREVEIQHVYNWEVLLSNNITDIISMIIFFKKNHYQIPSIVQDAVCLSLA